MMLGMRLGDSENETGNDSRVSQMQVYPTQTVYTFQQNGVQLSLTVS